MTAPVSPESAARDACRATGLPDRPLTRLRAHATSVYALPDVGVVVRVNPATHRRRLETAVSLTRWLAAQGFPTAEPTDVPQPAAAGPYIVTFWKHYPQPARGAPPCGHLGRLLRLLHALPSPPVELPAYRPLSAFTATLTSSRCLSTDQRTWLAERSAQLVAVYEELDFPLGVGHVHGDAYPGNLLWDGATVRLGDWDETAAGPREVDLANTFQGIRFGRTEEQLDAFTASYGYDIRDWPGLPVLSRMRDLHTLGAYVRRADRGDRAAAEELHHRVATLREGADQARWNAG
ncbi:phosphotransferase [Streptomyces chumphonensis]|uniref:phosphotransferase n=1 Tax=Streptomyces chumphonensis TaxID=1214925 RepID=UPI003D764C0A